jgi:hypothetical protein
MADTFWGTISEQLRDLLYATTAGDVIDILAPDHNPFAAMPGAPDAFFAGQEDEDGNKGTATVWDHLRKAGWRTAWSGGEFLYVMRAPDASLITYDNGRIYLGDRRPEETS